MPVQVHESYKEFAPRPDVVAAVNRLVSSIPSEYLVGLSSIVLTNAAAVPSDRTWRLGGQKWRPRESYSVYHRATRDAAPWIELIIDNLFAEWPPLLLRFKVVQDLVIGSTLYHEVGHHVDARIGGRRERESGADEWSRKLSRIHFRRKYWYLAPAILPARSLVRLLIRLRDAIRRRRIAKAASSTRAKR